MIGLEAKRLDEALSILKCHAGERMETTFLPTVSTGGSPVPRKGTRRRNHGIHPEC